MSLWSRFFGDKYEDDKLVSTIQTAILEDPMITNPGSINVDSKDGVITLTGRVDKVVAKDHIEGAVRDALRYGSLKHVKIVNDIKVGSGVSVA